MKRLSYYFIILFAIYTMYSESVLADTIPDSTYIYGVWDLEGSPYTIIGLAIIPVDSTLIIEPGVRVEFKSSMNDSAFFIQYIDVGFIKAYGNIIANGAENDSITFTSAGEGHWGTINFFDVNDTCRFKYCKVSLSSSISDELIPGENYIGGLGFFDSHVSIQNSILTNNTFGIYCSGSEFYISQNNIISNYWQGINVFESSGSIKNNFIYDNNEKGITSHTSTTLIANNLIEGQLKGINSYESFDSISNNIIRYNLWGGITITRNNSVIYQNIIYGGNSGIRCNGQPRIINNTIVFNNYFGIYCDYEAKPIIINSIIYGNQELITYESYDTVVFTHCLVQVDSLDPGLIDAGGNIFNEDPLFVDPNNEDFSLISGSPCINTGILNFEWDGELILDLDSSQYIGPAPDIGAIESTEVSIKEDYSMWQGLNQMIVYPNPSAGETITIYIHGVENRKLHLAILNSVGSQIHYQEIHTNENALDISKYPSGVYLVVIYDKGKAIDLTKIIVR